MGTTAHHLGFLECRQSLGEEVVASRWPGAARWPGPPIRDSARFASFQRQRGPAALCLVLEKAGSAPTAPLLYDQGKESIKDHPHYVF